MKPTFDQVLAALRRPRTFPQIRHALRFTGDDRDLWDVLLAMRCEGLVVDFCDMTPKWTWELTAGGKKRLARISSRRR